MIGDNAYFFADDGSSDCQLWTAHAPTNSVRLVAGDVNIDANLCAVVNARINHVGNKVFFPLDDGSAGLEYWMFDVAL